MAPFRSRHLQWLAALAVVCLFAPSARGDFFAAYTPARHNRFTTGTTANPTFILAGHDLSAIAMDGGSSSNGTALITPEHVIAAWHFRPTNIDFVGTDGVVRTYSVANWTRLTTAGVTSDVGIGRLSTEVVPADNINPLPIAIGPDTALIGHELYAISQSNRAGRNLIDEIVTVGTSPTDPTVTTAYDFDSYVNGGTGGVGDDEIGLSGGDSGHASLIEVNGQLGVLGTHFAISTGTPGLTVHYSSFSSLARDYLSQIDALVQADGQTLSTLFVPEPAGALALLGVAGLLLVRRRSVAA